MCKFGSLVCYSMLSPSSAKYNLFKPLQLNITWNFSENSGVSSGYISPQQIKALHVQRVDVYPLKRCSWDVLLLKIHIFSRKLVFCIAKSRTKKRPSFPTSSYCLSGGFFLLQKLFRFSNDRKDCLLQK